jgi:hypothetical protein
MSNNQETSSKYGTSDPSAVFWGTLVTPLGEASPILKRLLLAYFDFTCSENPEILLGFHLTKGKVVLVPEMVSKVLLGFDIQILLI